MTAADETMSERLARFTSKLKYDDLPLDVVNRTKLSLLDTIGCAIEGSQEDVIHKAYDLAVELDGRDEATIIGHSKRTSAYQAIMVNSMMIQVHEYDDIALRMHPSRNVIPPILSVAEWKHASGVDLLTAATIGYEVQCLLFNLMQDFSTDLHGGVFDACGGPATVSIPLSVGRLLGLTENEVVEAVGLCSSGGYPSGEGIIEWQPAEVFTCGFLGQRGLTSVLLAQKGALKGYGPRAVIEGPGGLFSALTKNMDLPAAHRRLDRLGKDYVMTDAFYYKLIAQCRATHKAVEAALNIVRENPLDPSQIDTVDVLARSGGVTHRFRPRNMAQATFCTPLGVALAILHRRRLTPADLRTMEDPSVLEMMGKVRLIIPVSDIRLEREPSSAIVEVTTVDGKKFVSQVVNQKGMPEDPVTDEEVITKFRQLSCTILGDERTERILEIVLNLEEIDDVNELTRLLTPL